jgi:hypothetical protein
MQRVPITGRPNFGRERVESWEGRQQLRAPGHDAAEL